MEIGWNLISIGVVPADASVESVLASIDGLFDIVETMDADAVSCWPDPCPGGGRLDSMDPYHGYWVSMQETGTLSLSGATVEPTTPLALGVGWNAVGFLGDESMPVESALSSIQGQYAAVLGFDDQAVSFYPDLPPGINTLTHLRPGHGYLIKMIAPSELVYPDASQ